MEQCSISPQESRIARHNQLRPRTRLARRPGWGLRAGLQVVCSTWNKQTTLVQSSVRNPRICGCGCTQRPNAMSGTFHVEPLRNQQEIQRQKVVPRETSCNGTGTLIRSARLGEYFDSYHRHCKPKRRRGQNHNCGEPCRMPRRS